MYLSNVAIKLTKFVNERLFLYNEQELYFGIIRSSYYIQLAYKYPHTTSHPRLHVIFVILRLTEFLFITIDMISAFYFKIPTNHAVFTA